MGIFCSFKKALGPLAAVAFGCNALVWIACGGTPVQSVGGDSGPPFDAGAPLDGAKVSTCALGDGGVPPQGEQLVVSPTAFVLGVTTDGYAIYDDRRFSDIYAVPLTGGTPIQLGPAWSSATNVYIFGSVVVYWTGVDFTNFPALGQLVVWTSAGKGKVLSGSSYLSIAVSTDGQFIAYSENAKVTYPNPDAGADGGTPVGSMDIVVSAPDGTGKKLVASKVPWSPECPPSLSFVSNVLVVASCASPGLPQPAAALKAYRGPNWSPGTSLNNTPAYTSMGHDANRISYYTNNSTLTVQNVTASGPPVPILGNVDTSIFSNDGTSIIFMSQGAVARSPVASSNLQLVAWGPFSELFTISPDDKWLLLNKKRDPKLGLYDLYLQSTAPGGATTALVTTPTGAFLNDWFTTDSSRVIFGANNKVAPYGFYGDFGALNLSALNGPSLTVSTTVWSAYATKGSKAVYNDGYDIVFPQLPTADIQVVDLANPTVRTKLVSHADGNFYLNSNKTKAVYSWTYCADDRAGLYVVDLP